MSQMRAPAHHFNSLRLRLAESHGTADLQHLREAWKPAAAPAPGGNQEISRRIPDPRFRCRGR
jgi:hypothetical protein